MIKTIHCIKSTDSFTPLEKRCVESWKKVYPDFEIRFWFLDEFSMSYSKLKKKILSEEGGLYLENDVYAYKRIPKRYFKRSFISWSPEFESTKFSNKIIYSNKDLNWDYALSVTDNKARSSKDLITDKLVITNRHKFGGNDFTTYQIDSNPYMMDLCLNKVKKDSYQFISFIDLHSRKKDYVEELNSLYQREKCGLKLVVLVGMNKTTKKLAMNLLYDKFKLYKRGIEIALLYGKDYTNEELIDYAKRCLTAPPISVDKF